MTYVSGEVAPLNTRPVKKFSWIRKSPGLWKSLGRARNLLCQLRSFHGVLGSTRRCSVLWFRFVRAYLVKAQIILDGVRRIEDGPTGSDDEDKAVESLQDNQKLLKIQHLVNN